MFANVTEVESLLRSACHSLFRWEAQGIYRELPVPLQRGNDESPQVPTDRVWMLSDPATTSQRGRLREMWRYLSAGERLWALEEECAIDLGLPDQDFWIIDAECVLCLHYDHRYMLIGGSDVTGSAVERYRTWSRYALSHAVSPVLQDRAS